MKMKLYQATCPRCGRLEFQALNPYNGIMQLVAHLRKDIMELTQDKQATTMRSSLDALDAELVIYPPRCKRCGSTTFDKVQSVTPGNPEILTCTSCRFVQ